MRLLTPAAFAAAVLLAAPTAPGGEPERRTAALAGTCAACHLGGEASAAIPGLAGRDPDAFLAAMRAFRSGERESAIMATVTTTLSDEELALLARHFAAEPPGDTVQ